MSNRETSKNIKLNIVRRLLACFVVFAMLAPAVTITSHADVATDTLSVKVGYTGMKLSEYVEVGTYHWSELSKNLSTHEVAYSYFQQSSKKKYTAIVDSARGFYISDLLDYANLYTGDIQSLKFYVEDHKGIQAAFDTSALFRTRYYYKDVAGHRKIVYGTYTKKTEVKETVHHDAVYKTDENGETVYDEEGNPVVETEAYDEEVTKTVEEEVEDKSKIVEYNFDQAKKYASAVEPMLALEDNWAQFNEEFEHTKEDFSSLNTGTRFRLLFGQTSPTESMTSSSAKYVSCVYVTLDGQPKVGDMGGLNGKAGSHKVTMTVSADNVNVRNALSELMNVKSTNTDVLVITGVTVTPDSKYSDLATVTVSYDIVGTGEAAITAGVGSNSDPIATTETVVGEGNPKGSDKTDKNENTKGGSTERNQGEGSTNNKADKKNSADKNEELKEQQKSAEQTAGSSSTFELSDEAQAELQEALQSQTQTAALEDIEEVKKEDTTEEDKDKERKIIILTGLGCLGMAGVGAGAEAISFRLRVRGRRIK